jgi:tryptophan 7-halogenase
LRERADDHAHCRGSAAVNRRVKRVVVVGADAPAWMAAAAIHRSLNPAGIGVRVIELPTLLQPVDAYSAIPALAGLHSRIGLEESVPFKVCKAVPMAGQRFSNWAAAAPPFILGYDRATLPGGGNLGFTQFWTRGRQQGLRTELGNFSLGAVAAKAGRVPISPEDAELSAAFGYHLDAGAYSALLRHFTVRGGIETKASTVADVEIEGDRIGAVVLADGERVEADLFVDASGSQAVLIGRMPGAEFESWREWLPCDRMIVASGIALRPYPGFSQISAFRQGWIGLFPLQDRTAVVAAYDSRQISDQEVLDRLPVLAKLPISGDAVVSGLSQGIRKRNWVGNCVAVGESAVSLDPLDAVQLHMAHNCISQLMTLFPVEAGAFPEAELYDLNIHRVATNLRDFQAAHYKLNRRFDEPLWDRCRDAAVPESLQRKLDVFAARGLVPLFDDETFEEQSWESLFIGHGLMPQSYDPRVDAVPEQELIARVQQRLQDIIALVEAMPPTDDFVTRAAQRELAEVSVGG